MKPPKLHIIYSLREKNRGGHNGPPMSGGHSKGPCKVGLNNSNFHPRKKLGGRNVPRDWKGFKYPVMSRVKSSSNLALISILFYRTKFLTGTGHP